MPMSWIFHCEYGRSSTSPRIRRELEVGVKVDEARHERTRGRSLGSPRPGGPPEAPRAHRSRRSGRRGRARHRSRCGVLPQEGHTGLSEAWILLDANVWLSYRESEAGCRGASCFRQSLPGALRPAPRASPYLTAVCIATMPPVRFSQLIAENPAARSSAASVGWSGKRRIESLRYDERLPIAVQAARRCSA